MLTKKDFIAIADVVSKEKPHYPRAVANMSEKFADYFAKGNPRFNRALFLRACGDMNQCDGCCRSLPVVDGNHVTWKTGEPLIGCTKNRYEEVTHEEES